MRNWHVLKSLSQSFKEFTLKYLANALWKSVKHSLFLLWNHSSSFQLLQKLKSGCNKSQNTLKELVLQEMSVVEKCVRMQTWKMLQFIYSLFSLRDGTKLKINQEAYSKVGWFPPKFNPTFIFIRNWFCEIILIIVFQVPRYHLHNIIFFSHWFEM